MAMKGCDQRTMKGRDKAGQRDTQLADNTLTNNSQAGFAAALHVISPPMPKRDTHWKDGHT